MMHQIVDGFLPLDLAATMRAGIDRHFGTPQAHTPATHMVWNYWHVPGLYTYLRTGPQHLFDVQPFVDRLAIWAETVGGAQVTWPYLSMYVPGCRQEMHNDATNGRFAYVYSLTNDNRKTSGGETVIYREGNTRRTHAEAGIGFYDLVEPRFNRLTVFDDCLAHAVRLVEGVMDPLDARFVLHGHLV